MMRRHERRASPELRTLAEGGDGGGAGTSARAPAGEEPQGEVAVLLCAPSSGGRVVCSTVVMRKPALRAAGLLDVLHISPPSAGCPLPSAVLRVAGPEEEEAAQQLLSHAAAGCPHSELAALCEQQLACMCRVADSWGAESLAAACKGALDAQLAPQQALTQPEADMADARTIQHLMGMASCEMFQDVHLLLTTSAMLQLFLRLPFEGVLAWAGSDGLVVDSENSVVVALDCWVRLGRGKGCSKEQLLQLSSLVRVKHLSPHYLVRLTKQDELPWWHHDPAVTREVVTQLLPTTARASSTATAKKTILPSTGTTTAWLAAPRKPLALSEFTVELTVSADNLERALRSTAATDFTSSPVYMMGHAVRLHLSISAGGGDGDDGKGEWRDIGVFVERATYSPDRDGIPLPLLATSSEGLPLQHFSMACQQPNGRWRTLMSRHDGAADVSLAAWGKGAALRARSVEDLERCGCCCADGSLRLLASLPVHKARGVLVIGV